MDNANRGTVSSEIFIVDYDNLKALCLFAYSVNKRRENFRVSFSGAVDFWKTSLPQQIYILQ